MPEENKNPDIETNPDMLVSDNEMKMPQETFLNTEPAKDKSSVLGAVLVGLIVVLVVILGGLYLWGATLRNQTEVPTFDIPSRPTPAENNEPESTNAEADVQALETVSTSNEIEAIEADIESTNLDQLDAELNAIEAEFDASFEN
jgi:cytoskeletal protein RodZ